MTETTSWSMRHVTATALLLTTALLLGCTATDADTGPSSGSPDSERRPAGTQEPGVDDWGVPLPEPELAPNLSNEQNARRLLELERPLDAWYLASEQQDYGKKASLELLLYEYVNKHFDAILADLQGETLRRGRVAAAALGFSGNGLAMQPLQSALGSGKQDIVKHALLSIYHLGIGQGVPPDLRKEEQMPSPDVALLATFLSHPDPQIRSNAGLAMRPFMDRAPLESDVMLALISAAGDQDDRTRVHALAALGATKNPEAIPHLVKGLSDPTPLGRMRSALGLGRLGDPQVAPYLVEVLGRKDESEEVKKFVARSLRALFKTDLNSTHPDDWAVHLDSLSR